MLAKTEAFKSSGSMRVFSADRRWNNAGLTANRNEQGVVQTTTKVPALMNWLLAVFREPPCFYNDEANDARSYSVNKLTKN